MDERRRALAFIHVSVFLFGLSGLFGKLILLNPLLIVFGRTLVASSLLCIFRLLRKKTMRVHGKWGLLFPLGALLALHWVSFFQAIRISSVSVGVLTYSTFPAFTAVLEPVFEKRRPDPAHLAAAFTSLGGAALVVGGFTLDDAVLHGGLWGILSGFSFSLLSLGNRRLVRRENAGLIALYENATVVLLLAPVLLIRPEVRWMDVFYIVLLGSLCTACAHSLFIRGMLHVRAATAGILAMLEPVYGIFLAALLLGERVPLRTAGGGLLILGSAVFILVKTRSGD